MAKVAIIGAGSIVFCKTLMQDILATPGLEDTEFALMAPSTARTSQVEAFAQRVIKDNKLPARVWKTTDRRKALEGADYVVATFQVGASRALRWITRCRLITALTSASATRWDLAESSAPCAASRWWLTWRTT